MMTLPRMVGPLIVSCPEVPAEAAVEIVTVAREFPVPGTKRDKKAPWNSAQGRWRNASHLVEQKKD